MIQTETKTNPFREVIASHNFRRLWVGEGISVLGDHFYMVALPWLVLRLTGDSLAMGTVLALSAIPRALLTLVGGTLTDRFSPRSLMLASNAARFIFVSLLAGLVFTNNVEMWMLYTLAILFGVADAFFYPAQSSMTPQLVKKENLQVANSLIHGTMMLAMLAGPVLAGVFSSTGLFAVSMALSSALSRVDVTLLLTVSGGIVALLGFLMPLNPTVRAMESGAQIGD